MGLRLYGLPADRLRLVLHCLRLIAIAKLRRHPDVRCRTARDSLHNTESVRRLRQDQVARRADRHSRIASGITEAWP